MNQPPRIHYLRGSFPDKGKERGPVMLDLFAGSGEASAPWKELGYTVYRYDNNPRTMDTYIADLSDPFHVKEIIENHRLQAVKFIWASPPCPSYSHLLQNCHGLEYNPDLLLWKQTLKLIEGINPEFYTIENVRGATRTWGKPVQIHGAFYLWGRFPKFSCPREIPPKRPGHNSAAKAAIIPRELSEPLRDAIIYQSPLFRRYNEALGK